MDIRVEQLNFCGKYEIRTIPQELYRTYPCPICGQEDVLQKLGIVYASDGANTSLESVFCTRCQHRFHRKLPNPKWLQEVYYRTTFQQPQAQRNSTSFAINPRAFLGRVRHQIARLVIPVIQYVLPQIHASIPNRVYDFTGGVLKDDRSYFLSNEKIKKVLEIGCGYGDTLRTFKELGYETYGIEASSVRAKECQRRGFTTFLVELDDYSAVKTHAPFDFIYSKHVLEHIVDIDNHIRILGELLDEGGFLYIETPDLSGEFLIHQTGQFYHTQTFSLRSMGLLLGKHGFEPVRVLKDNNLQVLARKTRATQTGQWFSSNDDIRWEERLPYLKRLQESGPGHYAVRWDHYAIEVERLNDRSRIYQANWGPFCVKRLPTTTEMVFTIEPGAHLTTMLPVRFLYTDYVEPPIWCKY